MNKSATKKRLVDLGYLILDDTPDEFTAVFKAEIASLGKIMQQIRFTAG